MSTFFKIIYILHDINFI